MRRTAALIAGGGPAGSAAAIVLAHAGATPLVIERSREPPDPLCGGFLSWRTLASLYALGLEPERLGGEPIGTLRMIAGTACAEARLPSGGRGLSRRALDAALLARAAAVGARIERGLTIREAVTGGELRLADGAHLYGDALFLATGKHELRGLARPRAAAGRDPALGLRVRLTPSAALTRQLAGAIELHGLRGGYAGLLLQEDGSANLCMAVRRSRLDAAGGDLDRLLDELGRESPLLGDRLGGALTRSSIEAIAHVPYGWRATQGHAGLFRMGDQAGVIPSLAGEGVGIALVSGRLAAQCYLNGGVAAGASFQPMLARRLRRPIGLARMLLSLAEHPSVARALVRFAGVAPALIDPLARLTRIDARAPWPKHVAGTV